jgi:hypothetical protein
MWLFLIGLKNFDTDFISSETLENQLIDMSFLVIKGIKHQRERACQLMKLILGQKFCLVFEIDVLSHSDILLILSLSIIEISDFRKQSLFFSCRRI